MASGFDPAQLKTADKLAVTDKDGNISSLVFPHKMQIGTTDDEYQSNLEVHGSVILGGDNSTIASKNTSIFRGGGFIYANSAALTGSLEIPESYNALIMGPYVVGEGYTLTVSSGSSLVVKGFEDF